jgi:two-component sensor histidine kinase
MIVYGSVWIGEMQKIDSEWFLPFVLIQKKLNFKFQQAPFTMKLRLLLIFCIMPILITAQQNDKFESFMRMPNDSIKVDSLSNLGADLQFTEMALSLKCQQTALSIAESLKDEKRKAVILYRMANVEKLMERYNEALQHFQIAYLLFESQKNHKRLIMTTQKFGQIYENKADNKLALTYFKKTLDLAKIYKNEEYQAHAFHSIASIEKKLGKITEAEKGFLDAIKLYKKLGEEEYKLNSEYNLSGVYTAQNRYDEALVLINNYVAYFEKKGISYELAMAYKKRGRIYFEAKNYTKAIENNEKASLFFDKQKDYFAEKADIQEEFRKIHEAQNNIPAAYQAQKEWRVLNDSLIAKNNRETFATLQTKFETTQKEAQIKALDKENSQKTQQLLWAIIGLSVLAVSMGVGYYLYRKLQHKNQKIAAQSNQLSTLMKELHHRVKNNLAIVSSLLSIQSDRLEDESASRAVREGQMRVQAMSLIHQRLYKTEDVSTLNIKNYLTDLCESLMEAYGYSMDNFDLEIKVDKPDLDVDLAIPIGLIVNELVTNSFKYAYQNIERPSLKINLQNEQDITLQVQDNGIGFDEKAVAKKDSFGKELIKGLSKQIRGKTKYLNENGTFFELKIEKMAA